jgi:hypothetical protein
VLSKLLGNIIQRRVMFEYRLPEVDQRQVTKIDINIGCRNAIGVSWSGGRSYEN